MDEPDAHFPGSLAFIEHSDTDKGRELLRKVVEEDLMNQPTHLQREAGIVEIPWPRGGLPSEKQLGLMKIPQFLQCLPGAWSAVEMADRVAIMKYCEHPVRYALRDDLLDIIDWMPHVKGWLKNWQQEVNFGQCWWLPGRFGAQADLLLKFGYLLTGPKAITGYYHNVVAARGDIPADKPGSPAFVAKAMGAKYLDWIQAVV